MPRDGYRTLSTQLTPEEAGLAQGLLATAGIDALLEDLALSSVDPLVRFAIGGTKLLVPEADVERARQLLDEAGVLAPASERPGEAPEIPEEVWSAPAAPGPAGEQEPSGWSGKGMLVAAILGLGAVAALALARRPHWPPWLR
jgi:hypothetical protein